MEDKVTIDLEGCRDIFDVIDRTIDGEVAYHKELDPASLGLSQDYADGFIEGMLAVKPIIKMTRDVAALGVFDGLFDTEEE